MSSLGKIQKNAEKFKLEQYYKNMTPKQYMEGIQNAVTSASRDLSIEYDKELNYIQKQYNEKLKQLQDSYNLRVKEGVKIATDLISIALLYELGNQLECFKEDVEFLDQKKEVVRNIYQNTMDVIYAYAESEDNSKAHKDFLEKEKKVKEVFGITR